MSSRVPSDLAAFEEMEQLVRALGEELARFRKRAIQAEGRLRELDTASVMGDLFAGDRVATLEAENRALRARVDDAASRTRAMIERVRFLRQQQQRGDPA